MPAFQEVFGNIFTVIIALEFKSSLRISLSHSRDVVRVRTIVLIALLAVSRKFIILDRSASEFSQDILESCSLTSASSASSHSAFRPVVWAVFAIILAIIISIARRWPRKFSIESSFHVVDAPMMDVASSGINAAAGTPDFQKNVTAGVVA